MQNKTRTCLSQFKEKKKDGGKGGGGERGYKGPSSVVFNWKERRSDSLLLKQQILGKGGYKNKQDREGGDQG